ncbi:MAG: phosphatidylserine decarboxylase, partial [Clostridia bacterium]|nr:phosphatidylserine decarboxylase [Clostridia bacterium]
LKALYNTRTGSYVLKVITRPGFSRKCAGLLDSRYSKLYIKRFIKRNDIDMSEYMPARYRSFNDFFIRKIRPDARPIDMDGRALIAPCDSTLSVYRITDDNVFAVKGAKYTIKTLLQDEKLAEKYRGGLCLIFRLMPFNYHRYIYPDNGSKGENVFIQGKLHTVREVAHKYSVYATNSREYTILDTENFGKVVFMEVGALMVGRIVNHHQACSFSRGDEKGYFEYGGSTIIMLLQNGCANLDEEFMRTIDTGHEAPVQVGQRIGERADA